MSESTTAAVSPADDSDAPAPTGSHALALRTSDRLRQLVDFVGRSASWLAVPLVIITCIDVILRKLTWEDTDGKMFSAQLWMKNHFGRIFDSTLLQELEWHFHTGLFTLVLGYGLIYNIHVRVDLVRETLAFRKKVWLEFLGLTFFMLPYCVLVIYFSLDYVKASYVVNEVSASTVGLSHRWMIKSVLVIGLLLAAIAGIAVWLQVAVVLWGPQKLRFPLMTLEWPEEAGKTIMGKKRIELNDDSLVSTEAPTEEARARTSAILTS